MTSRHRHVGLLVAVVAATAAGRASAEAAPCIVTASTDRSRATVGEQVVYSVRTLRRSDVVASRWTSPGVFSGFRSMWLSERPTGESTERDGHGYEVREERHALFSERAGAISIAGQELRCTTGSGPGARESAVRVPTVQLQVVPIPAGAPADFDGIVGEVSLRIVVTPREIRLGESVRVAVTMRGEGALWNARDPFPDVATTDVFRRRPELTTEAGARLRIVRHFAYDIVPTVEGALALRGFEVPFFDPVRGRFDSARATATSIAVRGRAAGVAEGTPPAATAPDRVPAEPTGNRASSPKPAAENGKGWALAALAGALLGAGAAAVRRSRRRRRGAEARISATDPGGDADRLAAELREALAPHLSGAASLTAEEIRNHAALPARAMAAAELLVAADRARFDPRADAPTRDSVEAAIAAL